MVSIIEILFAFTIIATLQQLAQIIWTLYFHPLHAIPGPKSWIAFPILRYTSLVRGHLDTQLREFHDIYGEAVRFGPTEVSFTTAQAWKDIYGHNHGNQLPKVLQSTSNTSDIFGANDADHSRLRRSLAHAFSTRGLQAQEPTLLRYTDKLIDGLTKIASSSPTATADMVKWYNLATFDLIGDLAFGEPFGGLDSSEYHPWVSTIFQAVRGIAFVRFKDAYPLLFKVLALFYTPKHLLEARKRQIEYSSKLIQKRLSSTERRGVGDFTESMLHHRDEADRDKSQALTDREIEGNANLLIIAGSETTATLLSGVTYWILRTPEVKRKVVQEVRSVIQAASDVNFQTTSPVNLPYMCACLTEALRIYPPAPVGSQRYAKSSNGMQISGYMIPPETRVWVHQFAAYHSPRNFHNPEQFIPERWLPETQADPSSPFYNDNREVLQPFSVGPRNCIGRNLANSEMRVILARILWHFDLELCVESADWEKQRSYLLWEKRPLMCGLKMRG
ncbi:hypothetical protein FE257_008503 [Aspergillus nanangensis]|uniref:Cytochrome P450 n=1 Tax=Aspergillus nanangensis TaxID=2582783 RepID=A0AAD4CLD8_ASPNN|nr:hypothetical protein FE257_008503 [Aspergillus nanangensis]